MIKKSIREVLSNHELNGLAMSYAMIISVGQNIPGMEKEVASAEKNLVELMKDLPEHIASEKVQFSSDYRIWIEYGQAYKSIESKLKWYSSGRLEINDQNNYCSGALFISPWEPKDEKVLKKLKTINKQNELNYNKTRINISAEEKLAAEKEANKKEFEHEINKFKNALIKFQYQKLVNKKVSPLKRFKIENNNFYEVAEKCIDIIESIDHSDEQSYKKAKVILQLIGQKAESTNLAICQLFDPRQYYFCDSLRAIRLRSFKDKKSAKAAIDRMSLHIKRTGYNTSSSERYDCVIDVICCGNTNSWFNEEWFSEEHKNILNKAEKLNVYDLIQNYFAIKYLAEKENILYFREFCETMGLLPPKEEKINETTVK